MDTGYAQKKRCRARNSGVRPEGGKGSLGWKGFVEQLTPVHLEKGHKMEAVVAMAKQMTSSQSNASSQLCTDC